MQIILMKQYILRNSYLKIVRERQRENEQRIMNSHHL